MVYYVEEEKLAAVHPGEILAEKLEEMGMSIKEFAVKSTKPEQTVIAVISGKSSITPDMAVGFEIVTGIKADSWLRMQRIYDEYKARKRREALIEESVAWARNFPYLEMSRHHWLDATTVPEERAENLLSYFGLSSPKAWNDYYINQKLKVAFSLSLSATPNPYALSAWLRQGELQALPMPVNTPYSANKLKTGISQIVESLVDDAEQLRNLMVSFCQQQGICLVFVSSLPKLKVLGVARWIKGVPCIQLSNSIRSAKQLCFVFLHELAHILLHGKKDIFIEFDGNHIIDGYREKEAEADDFASKLLSSRQQ